MNLVVLVLDKPGEGRDVIRTLREGSPGDMHGLATLLRQLAEHQPDGLAESEPVDAAPGGKLPPEGLDLKAHMERIEVELIRQALERAEGVVAHAANTLGLRRTTLVEKLRKYRLGREAVNGTESTPPSAH